VSFEPGRL